MNAWPLAFGLLTLSACAEPATPQQSHQQPPDAMERSVPSPSQHPKKTVDEKSQIDTEKATRKIDEIDQRLKYLQRYIGPKKDTKANAPSRE